MQMRNYRIYIIAFLMSWPLLLMSQSQDFQIKNFHENVTDLSAITSNVKDNNGKPTALIRFTVRDSKFEFNANLGIVRQERKTGEVWLYVPVGTKRLTISHPHLGVLRGYEIPTSIEGKTTYDVEIVITNELYLQSLYAQQEPVQEEPVQQEPIQQPIQPELDIQEPVQQEPEIQQEPAIYNESVYVTPSRTEDTTDSESSVSQFHVYGGIGFNALSVMGPSVLLGISYSMFCLEGGFVYGLDKVEDIRFTLRGSSTPFEAYDYSCSKAWLRLGVNFDSNKFRISPQAGATFNMISGKEVSGFSNRSDYFGESNPIGLFAAVRLSYEVVDHLYIHLTPQYDFTLGGDQVFDFIKESDNKIKAFGEGFGINAGIIYEF